MRLFLLLLLIVGLLLGLGYPWANTHFSGEEIGSWRVYDRSGPYRPVTVHLQQGDAPVRAFVDMQPLRNFIPTEGRTALTAVVTRQGRDILVETLSYASSKATNKGSPQGPQVYRDSIGDIDTVADGDYTITIGPGDYDGLEVAQVDLVLRRDVVKADWRVVSGGIALTVIGIVGLILLRRRRRSAAKEAPPQPKWGR